ncbi:MAG: 30S ribosomal protein S16 [Bdellovibrionales bacterium]|nr:30S ribosomal protein S16 [Bdellovibrionales bacterium]
MVVIRLARGGAKRSPKYRIAVADQKRSATGRFIEVIGTFNPSPKGSEKELVLDLDKAKAWVSKGAQPTRRVKDLIRMAESGKN